MPSTLIDDLCWCWWTRPRATQIGDQLFVGGLDAAGSIVVARVDLASGSSSRHRLATLEDDDHNNPAVVAVAGRPLVAFYARHSLDDVLRFRLSTGPLDETSWMPERELAFDGVTTYAQVHATGDALHVFTRVGETGWAYRLSPDWGATWGPATTFINLDTDQQAYMPTTLLDDGRTLRVAISGHPKDYDERPLHQVWTCLVDLETGDVALPSDGGAIANLRTGAGLPLDELGLELAHATPPDRTVNIFDVSDGPDFEIAFVSKVRDDRTTRDAQYHVATLAGGGWMTENVAPAGTIFGYIPAGFYVGGQAFPHRSCGGNVYVAREAEGWWHLEDCRRQDDGSWHAIPLAAPSRERIVRPWAVTNATGDHAVLALALEHYGDDYTGTQSRLVGYPAVAEPSGQ